MNSKQLGLFCIWCYAAISGFAEWGPGQAQADRVAPEWEVQSQMQELDNQLQALEEALLEVHPALWSEAAPREVYRDQLKSILEQSLYCRRVAGDLTARPERLSLALDVYLRLQSLDETMSSLIEAVRRYQGEELAGRLLAAQALTAPTRGMLRTYVVQLARQLEEQLKVMEDEAQRCREVLSRQPQGQERQGQRNTASPRGSR